MLGFWLSVAAGPPGARASGRLANGLRDDPWRWGGRPWDTVGLCGIVAGASCGFAVNCDRGLAVILRVFGIAGRCPHEDPRGIVLILLD